MSACDIEAIESKVSEVLRKATAREGVCLFRGEPERYPLVSSGLYRALKNSHDEALDISKIEAEIVKQARDYTSSKDAMEILAEIQHFGGKTNLLDFTEDYQIALFFASEEHCGRDGRIVLHWPEKEQVIRAQEPLNRVIFQKSVFIRSKRGFILPDPVDETIVVPHELKTSIREYLNQFHGIFEKRIYSDIHGYIRNQDPNRTDYMRWFQDDEGNQSQYKRPKLSNYLTKDVTTVHRIATRHYGHQKDMEYTDTRLSEFVLGCQTERGSSDNDHYWLDADEIVNLLTYCIEENLVERRLADLHCWRGDALLWIGNASDAAADFERAMEVKQVNADVHHGLANVNLVRGLKDDAIEHLDRALNLDEKHKPASIDLGIVRLNEGSIEEAVKNFEVAMTNTAPRSRYTWFRDSHFYRALARCIEQKWIDADSDFQKARSGGLRVAATFRRKFGSVAEFESHHDIRFPSIIKTQLHIPNS
ncbi:MAG: FRG domain-containing protein [Gammaproteobacteria bacterium]|nr:FRG domain-containing protein [Gammaproteobacteria bacterium]